MRHLKSRKTDSRVLILSQNSCAIKFQVHRDGSEKHCSSLYYHMNHDSCFTSGFKFHRHLIKLLTNRNRTDVCMTKYAIIRKNCNRTTHCWRSKKCLLLLSSKALILCFHIFVLLLSSSTCHARVQCMILTCSKQKNQ